MLPFSRLNLVRSLITDESSSCSMWGAFSQKAAHEIQGPLF